MEQYLSSLLDRSPEPIAVIGLQREVLYYNKALASFLGIPSDNRTGEMLARAWPSLGEVDLVSGTVQLPIKGGRSKALLVTVFIEAIKDGAWLLSPQLGRTSDKVSINLHAERLQTLGMLAGGVAHDFNNILAGIIGHTSYLKTILASASGSADSLRSIEDGAKKASLIIQQILNFSRLELVEVAVACDLGLVAQRTVALLRAAINPDIAIKLELPNDPVFVLGVEAKIAQVIVNLVVNARDAIVGEGRITVRVDVGQSKSSTREMGLIQVIDSGEGMSPETLKRAFEPYFSTKRDRGTGLGLATVHTIIEQCNGEIDVSSSLGNGTTFTIYFPLKGAQLDDRSDDQDMVRAAQEGAPLRSLSHEKILIVDDESPVRQVLSLSLQHLGYSVEVAQSGIEAIDRMEKRGERFDLVILDMLMPQLSGEEVFFRLQALQPDLRALIISGYSSEEAVENILVHGGKGFLQKPFTMSELSHKVRECLE